MDLLQGNVFEILVVSCQLILARVHYRLTSDGTNCCFFQVLHEDSGIVLDTSRALQIAADVAKGMQFLHSLDRQLPRFHLNSKHIMVKLD